MEDSSKDDIIAEYDDNFPPLPDLNIFKINDILNKGSKEIMDNHRSTQVNSMYTSTSHHHIPQKHDVDSYLATLKPNIDEILKKKYKTIWNKNVLTPQIVEISDLYHCYNGEDILIIDGMNTILMPDPMDFINYKVTIVNQKTKDVVNSFRTKRDHIDDIIDYDSNISFLSTNQNQNSDVIIQIKTNIYHIISNNGKWDFVFA